LPESPLRRWRKAITGLRFARKPSVGRELHPRSNLFCLMEKRKNKIEKPVPAAAPVAVQGRNAKKESGKISRVSPAKETDDSGHGKGHHEPSISSYLLGNSKKQEDRSDAKLTPFLKKQKQRLLVLRDAMLDSMNGVAQDTLRARAENNEASAFGMHQADAGSDSYDRDFALSLLSQEQDALYEIDEALKRIEQGSYGVCEMSGKPINHERLEAIPFTRYTVECQSQIERQNKAQRVRQSVTSLFGLTDDDEPDREEEEFAPEPKE